MIRIPSADMGALGVQYEEDSVQRQVFDAMESSLQVYAYPTVEGMHFELDLRAAIVSASEQLYRSRLAFAVFEKTRCNADFWDRQDNGGFQLKKGVKGSEAMDDIYTNGRAYATECATAMVIVYYKALLDLLGAQVFDTLFPKIYLMNWQVSDPLLRAVGNPNKKGDQLLGDRAYFRNPDVSPEAPWWQGENVIILPEGLYYGHGIGIQTADQIVAMLNRQRREGAEASAYLMDTVGRPDFGKLYAAAQRATPAPAPAVAAESPGPPVPEPVAVTAEGVGPVARQPLAWRPFPPPIGEG